MADPKGHVESNSNSATGCDADARCLDSQDAVPQRPSRWLRFLFFLIVVRPLMLLIMGMNVRHQEHLPKTGPAVIVANHNSHLDTFAVMTLFGMERLHLVRPVAAADYFLATRLRAWFSTRVLGIIALERQVRGHRRHPLQPISDALDLGQIVLLFPEGTRGEPEKREPFQQGIAHLAKRHPDVPIVPIFMRGMGKALPRGEGLLVPFICDLFIGPSVGWAGDKSEFMCRLDHAFDELEAEARTPELVEE